MTGPSGPTVDSPVINITPTSGSCGGSLPNIGSGTVTNKGLVWSSSNSMPTLSDSFSDEGAGGASFDHFSSNMSGLNPGTHYYVRSYMTLNPSTTSYSSVVTQFDTTLGIRKISVTNSGGKSIVAGGKRVYIPG